MELKAKIEEKNIELRDLKMKYDKMFDKSKGFS